MTSTQKSPAEIAQLLEGVDFIETEEDAKAVEAATLKIQSTFRGKKIRSKLGGSGATSGPEKPDKQSERQSAEKQQQQRAGKREERASGSAGKLEDAEAARELSKKVADMQVNDKSGSAASSAPPSAPSGASPEQEVERAATKIQAGFKGYRTRKELEGKLPAASGTPAGGEQATEAGQANLQAAP